MECKNCQLTLNQENDYCSSCGAKVIRKRLTLKNLMGHFSETYLNYDNKLLQTFLHLFTKPEDVIGGYINGTRKKYADVISYFAIALTFSGLQMFVLNKFFPEAMDISNMAAKGTEEFQRKNLDFIQEYQSMIMMLYVPLYALMSKLVFFDKKKYNYTEHLVIFMYIISQTSIVSATYSVLAAALGLTISDIGLYYVIPFQIIYSAYCLKRLFAISLTAIVLRTLFFLVILSIFMIIFGLAMTWIMMLNGDLQSLLDAKQNAV